MDAGGKSADRSKPSSATWSAVDWALVGGGVLFVWKHGI